MQHKAEIFTSAIVVLGAFNPTIFSPDWLLKQGLIGEDDAAAAREGSQGTTLLVSHQLTTVETHWFVLQVQQNRFNLASKEALSPALRDLAVGIFQSLPHTPVAAVGLNFLAHYKLASEQQWHELGDALAPKAIWNTLYPEEHAGLTNLTIEIQRGTRGNLGQTKDVKHIAIQPSGKTKFGALLSYNDHRDVSSDDPEDRLPAEWVAAIIDDEWESAWKDAERVFDGVLTDALGK